jgi:cysteine desulfurase
VGFGEAAKTLLNAEAQESSRISRLKSRLAQGFQNRIKDSYFNGHLTQSIANTLNVSFAGVDGLALALNLDLEGISVSTGSACLSGGIEPSPILKALGMNQDLAQSAVRFSLGWKNTEEEMDIVVEKVAGIVERLRKPT